MSDFLRNCWYVACSADEIGEKPFRRVLLDTPVALYRLADGTPVALRDRCPHRFVPLSLGKRVGDHLRCIYHGLEFDARGTCAFNPHIGAAQPRVRVRSYVTTERYGYVWIWHGEDQLADPSLLPRLDFLEDTQHFTTVRGYLTVDAHYQLITDNLLDLSHVEFLHPMFAREEGVAGHRTEFLQEGDTIIANRWKPRTSLNEFAKLFWDRPGEVGDGRANMRWSAPATLYFDLGVCEIDADPKSGACMPATHLLTPESANRTHYFWAHGRNRRLHDLQLDQQIFEINSRVFELEDRLVIEAQQRELGAETDILKLKPLLMKADTPTVMARRVLERLLKAQSAQATMPREVAESRA